MKEFLAILAMVFICLLVLLVQEQASSRLWAAPLVAVSFCLVQLLFSRSRPKGDHLICPINLAQLLFFAQLILVPLLIVLSEPTLGTLPFLPHWGSINNALIIAAFSHASFCLGYHLRSAKKKGTARGVNSQDVITSAVIGPTFCVIGIVGFVLTFSDLNSLLAYYTSPIVTRSSAEPTSFANAAATFLRPFLGFGLVVVWADWLRRRKGHRGGNWTNGFLTMLFCLGIAASALSFSYNRAAVIVPLICIAAAYSNHIRTLSFNFLSLSAITVGCFSLFLGAYRSQSFKAADLASNDVYRAAIIERINVVSTAQVYINGPQFLGFFLEQSLPSQPLRWGSTLLASAMAPVPVLGKAFREDSGTVIYNRLIYNNTTTIDQIFPFTAELLLNFSYIGLLCGFVLLGSATAVLQKLFEESKGLIMSYIITYVSCWLSFLIIGSVTVVSQIVIYFCPPIVGFLIIRRIHSQRTAQAAHFLMRRTL